MGRNTHFVVVVGIRYKGKDEFGDPMDYIINDPGASYSDEERDKERRDKVRYISRDTMRSKYWNRDITRMDLIDKE